MLSCFGKIQEIVESAKVSTFRKCLRWANVFPLVHLGLCATDTLAILVPAWSSLGLAWTFLVVADFPFSIVALLFGWNLGVPSRL